MIPAWSSPSPTSSSARIIPRGVARREARRSSSGEVEIGRCAPGSATATVAPASKFHAPHTISRASPSPTSTWQTRSRSAFGCVSDLEHPADEEAPEVAVDVGDAARSTAATTAVDDVETLGDLLDRNASTVDVLAEPGERGAHQNCLRSRGSLRQSSRRSRGSRAGARRCARAPSRTRTPCTARGRSRRTRRGSDRPSRSRRPRSSPVTGTPDSPIRRRSWHDDVGLDGRLGEREVSASGSRSARSSPKSALQQVVERPQEVGERDPLVDGEPLDLVERRRVRRVGRVPPVDAARARRCRSGGSCASIVADLRRRRLGAEDGLVVEEERLQRRARRVPGREVERVEVVARRLDLAAVDDRVAEAEEDVLDLAADLRDEVQLAARRRACPGIVTSTRSSVSRRSSSARRAPPRARRSPSRGARGACSAPSRSRGRARRGARA